MLVAFSRGSQKTLDPAAFLHIKLGSLRQQQSLINHRAVTSKRAWYLILLQTFTLLITYVQR